MQKHQQLSLDILPTKSDYIQLETSKEFHSSLKKKIITNQTKNRAKRDL